MFKEDRKELYRAFHRTNVDLIKAENVSSNKTKTSLRMTVKAIENRQSPYKCVFIVFSGHGGMDGKDPFIVCEDSKKIYTEKFINNFIKRIKVIPKVFLIDACRGPKPTPTKGPGDNCLIAYATTKGTETVLPSVWIPSLAEHPIKGDNTIVNKLLLKIQRCQDLSRNFNGLQRVWLEK